MSITKYQIFLKTAACGSFSKAAEDMNFTQSGISHAINSLEEELGVKLLSRNRGGVVLTADGRSVLPQVEKLCAAHHAMMQTVESLKAQIESQEGTIAGLQEELRKANIQIEGLNTQVDSLSRVSASERSQKQLAQEEAVRLANELNTCFYVVGSKKELKDNKIIESGFLRKTKIMESDYEKSYFTKADKRSLSAVPLHSKKAKVLSKHPAESYTIDTDAQGMKTLKIINGTRFWEMSNFLIVQID